MTGLTFRLFYLYKTHTQHMRVLLQNWNGTNIKYKRNWEMAITSRDDSAPEHHKKSCEKLIFEDRQEKCQQMQWILRLAHKCSCSDIQLIASKHGFNHMVTKIIHAFFALLYITIFVLNIFGSNKRKWKGIQFFASKR